MPNATATAISDTMIRVRSSSRWLTTLTRSSCEIGRTVVGMRIAVGISSPGSISRPLDLTGGLADDDRLRRLVGRRGRAGGAHLREVSRGALAVDRLLEAAHAGAQRTSHLRQPLGSEHQQQQNDDESEVKRIV